MQEGHGPEKIYPSFLDLITGLDAKPLPPRRILKLSLSDSEIANRSPGPCVTQLI
jgi:hypothetical protein